MADGYTSSEFQAVRKALLACKDADLLEPSLVVTVPLLEIDVMRLSVVPKIGVEVTCRVYEETSYPPAAFVLTRVALAVLVLGVHE